MDHFLTERSDSVECINAVLERLMPLMVAEHCFLADVDWGKAQQSMWLADPSFQRQRLCLADRIFIDKN